MSIDYTELNEKIGEEAVNNYINGNFNQLNKSELISICFFFEKLVNEGLK